MLKNLLQFETLLILYTNSKSFYDYLVKLGTIQEKCLIIDVMSLYQSDKRCKVTKIKWIYGHNNLADLIIRIKLALTLKIVIDINCINLDTIKWVEQVVKTKKKKKVERN